ncbi:MAG: B12-binding domain-containing radical SAM protein, partial [Candidatus Eremiobacteraeota bacterium]|nr:B12-binding domain-containing radical SAM protein [Candidatus Eremiobacteraeota bacterium]
FISKIKPRLIGINTRCDSFPTSINLAREIKKKMPDIPIVLGGFHVTFVASETLKLFPFVDFVLKGEAEYSLLELVRAIEKGSDPGKVRGLVFRDGNRIIEREEPEFPESLDSLPLPAYHHYNDQLKSAGGADKREIFINVGRGCPFHCEFCVCHKLYRGKYRLRTPENIIREMKMLKEKYGIYRFSLGVDHFLVDRDYVERFCNLLIKEKPGIAWGCNARPENLDEKLISLMKKSGLTSIFFGAESGSARIQKVIRKNIDIKGILPILKLCEKYDLFTIVAFIIGFPDETLSEMNSTIKLALDCNTYFKVFSEIHSFSPMAGTALYDKVKNNLTWTGIFNDFAGGPASYIPANIKLVKKYPELFSVFYSPPIRDMSPELLYEFIRFYNNILPQFPITLKVALEDLKIEPDKLFRIFKKWARKKEVLRSRIFKPSHADLLAEFPEFIRELYRKKKLSPVFMNVVLRGEVKRANLKFSLAKKYVKKMGEGISPLIIREMIEHKIG